MTRKDDTGWPGSAKRPERPKGREEAGGGGSQGGQDRGSGPGVMEK